MMGMSDNISADEPVIINDKFISLKIIYVHDASSKSVIALARDVTRRKMLEEKLKHLSITDELTGLLNRRGFMMMAGKQISIADRSKEWLFLLFADIDNMKWINDQLGHKVGDQALIETADLLRTTFRQSDILCRIGGDEFAVLLTCKPARDCEAAIHERLQKNLQFINVHGGRKYELLISVGIVQYDAQSPCSLKELLSQADGAMYECKRNKKSPDLKINLTMLS